MDKNPDLQIAALRRQILKQDEQIKHNTLYFLNKIKSNENQHKRDMDVMLFSFNNHALRIKDLEKHNENKGGSWFW